MHWILMGLSSAMRKFVVGGAIIAVRRWNTWPHSVQLGYRSQHVSAEVGWGHRIRTTATFAHRSSTRNKYTICTSSNGVPRARAARTKGMNRITSLETLGYSRIPITASEGGLDYDALVRYFKTELVVADLNKSIELEPKWATWSSLFNPNVRKDVSLPT